MAKKPILFFIKKIKRPVFTSFELANISGKSPSTVTQSLNYLEKQGLISKIYRGVWIEKDNKNISPYSIINSLFPFQKVYVSFLSALHLYGIVEQIPQIITLASTAHTKKIRTKLGVFSVHHIAPAFFKGFDWYKKDGSFLIAEPEKAFVDCLYVSFYKKKQFSHFPELHFPKNFKLKKVRDWINEISNEKNKLYVRKKMDLVLDKYK